MIPVRNIYYMLSYAFQALRDLGLKDVDLEKFDNVQQLCAEILIRGVKIQIKRGLGRDYMSDTETMAAVKGKIDVSETIKTRSLLRRQIVCEYDSFSYNTPLNQVIKATLTVLLRMDIGAAQKKEIKRLLAYFEGVDLVSVRDIDWKFRYNKNNQPYQMLVSVCRMIIQGYLQTQTEGATTLTDFIDEQRMSRLYEKFILEYYRRHYPQLSPNASKIKWQLDSGNDDLLPEMKSDIMLEHERTVLIIDAKYYSHTTQTQFDNHTVHSGNLYQIFTYVKNKECELNRIEHKPVSGVLLYARTYEEIQPDEEYSMSGNKILVKTLDLDRDFESISNQLNQLVSGCFETGRA